MTHVTDCPDHDNCNLIVSDGWPDQAGSWRSHATADVPPEARLNPDDPDQATIEDRRADAADNATLDRRPPTPDEAKRLRGERPSDG